MSDKSICFENEKVQRIVEGNGTEDKIFEGKVHSQQRVNQNWPKGNMSSEMDTSLGRKPISLMEIMQIDLKQSDASKKETCRKAKKNDSSLEAKRSTSAARRKRQAKLEKQRRQVRDYSSNTTISTVLGDLGKEIENNSPIKELGPGGDDILVTDWEITLTPPRSKNISNKKYVEQRSNNKFSTCDLEDMSDEGYEHQTNYNDTPVKVAIAVQGRFRPLANLCCGLLGGISLWQCLTVHNYFLYKDNFMEYFSNHVRSLQSIFYLLATISFVSVLDSYDIGHIRGRHASYFFPHRKVPLFVAAILTLTIFVSLIGAPLDEQLALSMYNNRSYSNKITTSLVTLDIGWWVTMNTARCVGAVITWLFFSLCLGPDALSNHLRGLLGLSKHNEAVKKEKNQAD